MSMSDLTKDALVTKLGQLMFANAELGAQATVLFAEIQKRDEKIKELEHQLHERGNEQGALELGTALTSAGSGGAANRH